ncbi:MAG: low molecular weight phosphotyrosine protein phosphatase [Bacteroidales bacterium]|jgi:protein-tyrosine phosphatase|nr:low molecular weight phosphotyrosine protein phosphatase [Bacteroidales bacterium]
MKSILFVCTANICRSPSAEGIFKTLARRAGKENDLFIDSAGISNCREGELPYEIMRNCAIERGYVLNHHARPLKAEDIKRFDYIIGMDASHVYILNKWLEVDSEIENKQIYLMSDFLSKYDYDGIPDPYNKGKADCEQVFDLLEDACSILLNEIINNKI